MKSLTGKFATSRGWALLLILFVGAGLLISACGDEETPTPTTPAPPPPPPPPPPEPEPPATPTGLRVSATTDNSITWTWNAVEDATAYAVQVSMDEMFGDDDAIALALTPTHTVADLPPSTSVFVRVAAAVGTSLEDALLSNWSTHVTGMTAAPPPPPEPPAVPTGLRVSDSGEDFIEWSWDAIGGADGYEVQFATNEMFDDAEIIARTADQTSYRRQPLPAGSTAYLRVRSHSGTGEDRLESAWSTHVTGMTPAPPPEPPTVPTGLRVSASGADFIEWSWDSVEGAEGYEVEFATNEMFDDAELIGRTADQTSYRREIPAGSTAYLRVRSHSGTGEDRLESAWSAHVTGMTDQPMAPAAPANLRLTDRGENYLEWSWDEVAGADGYDVQYSLDDERFTDQDATAELAATETSYRIDNLSTDMDVYLRVRAFAGSGANRLESAWSTHVTGMTEPPALVAPAVPEVTAISGGDDYIEWRWSAVSGADGYEVWYSADIQFDGGDPMHDVGTELTYRQTGLDFDTFGYLRIRAYAGSGADRLSSDWTAEAIGRTNEAPPPPPSPNAPSGLQVSATGENFVTWTWRAVPDVDGYQIQYSANEAFTSTDPTENLTAEDLSYTRENLDAGTSHFLRVLSFIVVDDVRYESDWSSPSTGMTDPPRPAVPTGLAVNPDTTDHDSIGWTWDPVAGVSGYEAQFSLTGIFTGDEQTFSTIRTSLQVDGREAESNGSLRVRSVMGTGASATFSDWSDAVTGRTTAPPEPTALPAPANLRSTGQAVTSITLAWDAVAGADTYEVAQRTGGGGWVPASCDGGGNEVTDTECEATGLTRGTTYDFRVQAVPDAGDDTVASGWTTLTGIRTEGAPPPSDIAGAGDLKVTWRSNATSITWRWQPSPDRDYQTAVLTEVFDPANPCTSRDATWEEASFGSSRTDTTNTAALLCVRGTYRDTSGEPQYDDPSWSWAARGPENLNAAGDPVDDDDDLQTTAIEWEVVFAGNTNIDYEFRYVADRAATMADDVTMSQATCEAASTAEILSPVGDGGTYRTTDRVSLRAYTDYGLCYRALNDSGRSDWAFSPDNQDVRTLPNAVSISRHGYTHSDDGTETTITWRIVTGANVDAPTAAAGYNAKTIVYPVTRRNTAGTANINNTAPTVEACDLNAGGQLGEDEEWTITANITVADDPDVTGRVLVTPSAFDRPTNLAPHDRVYVCVRPELDGTRVGAWTLSAAETVPDQAN